MKILLAVLVTGAVALVAHWLAGRALARRVASVARKLDPEAIVDGDGLLRAIANLERAAASTLELAEDRADFARRLAVAFDSIPQGVVIVDGFGEVLFQNEAGAVFSAARHGEALVEAKVLEMLGRAQHGFGGTETVELYGPPRRSYVIAASALEFAGAEPGAVAVIDDVTERRRLEAIRRDFVANISHELKTPVGAMSLLAETIAAESDPQVGRRLADRLLAEAERVGRTIDDLIELSRIESGEDLPREPVALRMILTEALDRARAAAEAKRVELRVEHPPPELRVVGDPRQLVSALVNLLDNAVKYTLEAGHVEVAVTCDGVWAEIAVADDGVGIPARDLDRIFQRFYRVDPARSRQTGGTGLGLAIVRHIAVNHGGECRVASREGEGSTFTLRLPLTGPGEPAPRGA